jgi:UV excision repair protein RAD23
VHGFKGRLMITLATMHPLTYEQPRPAPAGSSSTAAAPSTPAPATVQTPAPPAAPAPATSNAPTAIPATPTPAGAGTATDRTFNDPSALTMGNERAAAIENMESMGFPRDQIDRAMRAAFFNPDRAVEYLLNVGGTMLTIYDRRLTH